MDPLSDILTLLRPRASGTFAFDAAGQWAVRRAAQPGIKFCAVDRGTCWIQVEGEAQPQPMQPGDCFLLAKARAFVLASAPELMAAAPDDLALALDGRGFNVFNGGGDYTLVSCHFHFADEYAAQLLDPLPALVALQGGSDQAWMLRRMLGRLAAELKAPQPGAVLVIEHLGHLMLLEVLRLFLAGRAGLEPGWLQALADPQVGAAMRAMHQAPAQAWQLQALAARAGMSRAVFAQRFRALMGMPPIEYLTRWRMILAGARLRAGQDSIAAIAGGVGYASEYSFITAFTRVMGCPPGRYRRLAREAMPGAPGLV